jgi:hypothetical protein
MHMTGMNKTSTDGIVKRISIISSLGYQTHFHVSVLLAIKMRCNSDIRLVVGLQGANQTFEVRSVTHICF